MQLTIENFKSIQKVENFEFRPLNIMAGINSSGKTSLTQCLLLLKQTLTKDFSGILNYNGEYVKAASPVDLVYEKKATDNFHIGLAFLHDDLLKTDSFGELRAYDDRIDSLSLDVTLHINNDISVASISLKTFDDSGESLEEIKVNRLKSGRYKGKYTISRKRKEQGTLREEFKARQYYKVDFINFFPMMAERIDNVDKQELVSFPLMKALRVGMAQFLNHVIYIGPLRVAPVPVLSLTADNFNTVGQDGLYTRFILHKYQSYEVSPGTTLLQATKEWICNRLGLADDICVVRDGTNSYRVRITIEGLEVELYQVGFGLSQVLPIVVQGLMSQPGDYLIVDSPEVHMHPSVQGGLVDFFSFLSKGDVNVLIETHSDHIITRLRRRIAEGELSPSYLKLCFVTHGQQGSNYQEVSIDQQGSFYGYLPKGFYDSQDEDFKEIIKAKYHE